MERGEPTHNKKNTYSVLHNTTLLCMGLPPSKRLFRSLCFDLSYDFLVLGERMEILGLPNYGTSPPKYEWSTPGVLKAGPEKNLQSRVKVEDSIIRIENAIFDLGESMDSLCFLL
ncbi:hypothetical protein Tco_1286037 [Tanacetum coccineum]